jgi:hypothetical protein
MSNKARTQGQNNSNDILFRGRLFPYSSFMKFHQDMTLYGHYLLFFMVAISANSSMGIYHNNSAFYGHKSPNNAWSFSPHQMPLSKG